ncbi:MAG TPA: DUF4188 domain-containing protein [Dermatophilaceae bacterium]|nr:DUF4188 domain-containing protein [Dermatophilaceae bacterium]
MDRVTHAHEGPLALFLIGMQIRQPWRLDVVVPTFRAMPPMIAELEENRAAAARGEAENHGYLGSRIVLDGRGPTVLQWWRSAEDIYRYASATDLAHRPAWRAFYRYAAKAPTAVTIWHETYAVPAGGYESIYAGGRLLGLGALSGVVPVARRGERARERMSGAA